MNCKPSNCIPILFLISFIWPADLPNPEVVLDRMRMNYNSIEDMEVEIRVDIDIPGLRMPKKKIRYFYKAPDKTKIETTGFAVLPKENILPMMSYINNDTLQFQVEGTEIVDGHDTWILSMTDNMISRDVTFRSWVDQKYGIVLKSVAVWDTTEVMNMSFEYKFIDDVAFVPVKTNIKLKMPPEMRSLQVLGRNPLDAKKYQEAMKETDDWEDGEVNMEFRKYKLNQNLPDSFFPETEEEEAEAQ